MNRYTLQSLPYSKRKLWRKLVDYSQLPHPVPFNLQFGPYNVEGYSTIYVVINYVCTAVGLPPVTMTFSMEESNDLVGWITTHSLVIGAPVIGGYPLLPGNIGWNNSMVYRPKRPEIRINAISNAGANYTCFFALTMVVIP